MRGIVAGMRTGLILAVLVGLVGAQERNRGLERELERIREDLDAPGLSAAVAVGDRLIWSGGAGLADLEHRVEARGETVYRIASISKPIAAIAVLQLVESGKVSLDDPIESYVPTWPAKAHPVRIRHLLTHTSGIRHYLPGEFGNRRRFRSVATAIEIFRDDPLLFEPGTAYLYTTYGYNLLAGVVERASGLSFEEYLEERIFEPAEMMRSGLEHPGRIVSDRARPYVRGRESFRNAPYVDLSIKWAGGGMISTAVDLMRFHIALDRGRLIEPDLLEEAYRPTTLADGTVSRYGFGWGVRVDEKGRRWISHSGGTTGGSTYLLREPASGSAVAILGNVEDLSGLRGACRRLLDTARGR